MKKKIYAYQMTTFVPREFLMNDEDRVIVKDKFKLLIAEIFIYGI